MSIAREQINRIKVMVRSDKNAIRASNGDGSNVVRVKIGRKVSEREMDSRKDARRIAGRKNKMTGRNILKVPWAISTERGSAWFGGRRRIGVG